MSNALVSLSGLLVVVKGYTAIFILFLPMLVLAQEMDWDQINTLPGKRDSIFVVAREALRVSESAHDTLRMAQAHMLIGRYFFELGSIPQALDHYLMAERLSIAFDSAQLIASLYANLSTTHYYSKDTTSSLKYLTQAMAIFESIGASGGLADVYGRMGHYHEKKGNYSIALEYQNRALEVFQQLKDSVGAALIYENIGSIYEDLARYKLASAYFDSALVLLEGKTNTYRLANVYNNIGDVYRKTGKVHLGLTYSKKALELSRINGNLYLQKSALRDLAKGFSQLGMHDSAFYYQDKAYLTYERMYSEQVAEQIATKQVIYETEKKEAALAMQAKEIKHFEDRERLSSWLQRTFIIAFILVSAASIYVVLLQRHKIRDNKIILEQEQELHIEKLKNAEFKEAYLHEQLELRSNELTSNTLKIIRKNKLITELKEHINGKETEEDSRKLKGLIDQHLREDRNWEAFQNQFEKVHSDFYKNLLRVSPTLSPADIRLCSLMKLNLPSKEIASLLGISIDSLRIARYRLRRKLKLKEKENLAAYLIKI